MHSHCSLHLNYISPQPDSHHRLLRFMPDRSNRDGYQPLSQSVDDEADVGLLDTGSRTRAMTSSTRGLTRSRPGTIDLKKLDNAFKRFEFLFCLVLGLCDIVFLDGRSRLPTRLSENKRRNKNISRDRYGRVSLSPMCGALQHQMSWYLVLYFLLAPSAQQCWPD